MPSFQLGICHMMINIYLSARGKFWLSYVARNACILWWGWSYCVPRAFNYVVQQTMVRLG